MDFALPLLLLSAGLLVGSEETPNIDEQSITGITVINKAGRDLLRRRFPPRPRFECAEWGDWRNATCWWPSQAWEELPEACTFVPVSPKWPDYLKKLVESKAKEKYDVIQAEYKARGAPPRCGFCSRSFKCRTRNSTDDSPFCPRKQVLDVPSECNDSAPCLISREKGGCPPPLFLNHNRIRRIRDLIERKEHQKVMEELLAAQAPPKEDRGGFEASDPLPWEARPRVKRDSMIDDDSAFEKIQYDFWSSPFADVFAPRPVSDEFPTRGDLRMMARPVRPLLPMPQIGNLPMGNPQMLPPPMPPMGSPQMPPPPMPPMGNPQIPAPGHRLPMRPMRRLPKPSFGSPEQSALNGPPPPFLMNDHATIQTLRRRHGPFGPQILPFPRHPFFPMPFFPPPPLPLPRPRPHFRRPPPPPPAVQFIHELVHGTTCASRLDVCMCCCGHFVPNIIKGTCEDITKILPGIDKVVDDLVEKSKNGPVDSTDSGEDEGSTEDGPSPANEDPPTSDNDVIVKPNTQKLKLKPTAKFLKEVGDFRM
ncbi:hypothetical protein QR680_016819 [Steinernema hermaphroditum]|uniref:Uncharacterized protein n=1 Tax=Steinernema hermaphroditum TaxID=289476 RepID=A0AA39LMJ5_9BILA|nr:hypothetical protein QR680_016819 [Steinernema hermaphroditum]